MKLSTKEIDLLYLALYGEYRTLLAASNSPNLSKEQSTFLIERIKPITDLEHWGVVERWNYPDDGKGDCEDYVLLKRKILMNRGISPANLLITVVRKPDGEADN